MGPQSIGASKVLGGEIEVVRALRVTRFAPTHTLTKPIITPRALSSSFLWLILRILEGIPKKELLRGLWVGSLLALFFYILRRVRLSLTCFGFGDRARSCLELPFGLVCDTP